ncbi:response regulator transcription factor [Ruminiclostridium cellulolyticum]|uniref:Stage 0 sporulation protein A homolog n=1 Tax=Ruminiclostridium cellulolyticum (strain ATCC 35319 / DSM 5812 / JCM 6584 / H10) TaxID=394503 RepID=B8I4I3_RUMCH|nr:response regulator [Ruminiclostridium cellulolyticum]ACL74537.1 two component transcriptional regulator, AraC family [Ruminiclostridium cellulolyticum H10]
MFKVLLVDDEPMALEALRIVADWEELGFTVCGECSNGDEALNKIEDIKPDLVVTDLKMPGMDGLELIRKVMECVNSDIIFIIVSGYDEFDYAKEAMQYGVRYYVLKPVFKDEFSEVLLEIGNKLKKKYQLGKMTINNISTDIGSLLGKYLIGSLGEDEIRARMPEKISKSKAYWSYVCLGTPRVWETVNFKNDEISEDSLSTFKEMVNTVLEGIYIYPILTNTVIEGIVICITSEIQTNKIIETLKSSVSTLFGEGFYLGVGNTVNELSELSESMSQAHKAIDYRFFSAPGSIIYYQNIKDFSLNYSFKGIYKIEDMYKALDSLDEMRIKKAIEVVFSDFRREYTAPEIIKMYVVNIIYKSISIVTSLNGSTDQIPLLDSITAILAKSLIIDEMENMAHEYCFKFVIYAKSLKDKAKNSDMKLVDEYIRNNYTRNLTIREISKKLYIHPNYLGHQINKWFGCSFNEYLHGLRMEEAKNLIENTNLKVHEIAERVGYSSYSNFLDQFVKRFSIKPSDYKIMLNNKN